MKERRLGTSAVETVPGKATGCDDIPVVNSIRVLNAFGLPTSNCRCGSRPNTAPLAAVPWGLLRLSAWHLKQISYSFAACARNVLADDCPFTPRVGGVTLGDCGV